MQLKSLRFPRRGEAGFTLVELIVTMVIVSVGMLGLVKLQAAGVSESRTSRIRSLMTFQAESLASLMRANRGYWAATGLASFPSFIVSSDGTTTPDVSSAQACTSSACTNVTSMAYSDLNAWATAFSASFPGATASVTCVAPTGACSATSGVPTSYDILLSWSEKTVAVNRASTGTTSQVSMILHVQP